MGKQQLRVTGFTRFVLVMIVVLPLAYLGASYFTGETIDFKSEFNKLTGKEKTSAPAKEEPKATTNDSETVKLEVKKQEAESSIKASTELNNKVYNLEQKLAAKEAELEAKNEKIIMLEDQIRLYRERDKLKAKLDDQ